MKTIAYLFAALAASLCLYSCSVEPMVPADEGDAVTIISATLEENDAETRTVRQADLRVFWNPADEISVFTAPGADGGARFISTNTTAKQRADFAGSVAEPSKGGYYYALYPYSSSVSFDGSAFQVTLPDKQVATPGTFADDLFISMGRSMTTSVTFNHLTGGIKFTVTEPDIQSVVLVGLGNEPLAGEVKAGLGSDGKTPTVTGIVDGKISVTLEAPSGETLEVGKAYHIVTLPVTFENGFTLLFQKPDGSVASRRVSKRVDIQRAHFGVLNEADKNLTWEKSYFEMSPYELTLNSRAQEFKLYVRSSAEPHIDLFDDWITFVRTEGDYRAGANYVFRADRNKDEQEREGFISVCVEPTCRMLTVTQEGSKEGDWVASDFVHRSLGMRFTATWCGYCPMMSKTFKASKEELGDRFEYVCFYSSSSGGKYGFPFIDALMDQYKVSGFPTGIVDGRIEIENYDYTVASRNVIAAVNETEANYPTVTAAEIVSSVNGREASVDVTVFVKADDTYVLTVLLLENGIVGYQADNYEGSHQDFVHDKVARLALTSIPGDSFTAAEGESKTFSFKADVPDECNLDNMQVLVYVQRPFGSQPAISTDNYGGRYVDNCRAAALGTVAELELK